MKRYAAFIHFTIQQQPNHRLKNPKNTKRCANFFQAKKLISKNQITDSRILKNTKRCANFFSTKKLFSKNRIIDLRILKTWNVMPLFFQAKN